jgi:hypothetical protein
LIGGFFGGLCCGGGWFLCLGILVVGKVGKGGGGLSLSISISHLDLEGLFNIELFIFIVMFF